MTITIAVLLAGSMAGLSQDPVPPVQPPVTSQPAPPPAAVTSEPAPPPRAALSEADVLRRRNAIFLMEGLLVNSVRLAASQTQTRIESAQPDLKVTLFSQVPPEAWGNHLDDYGVFFHVIIPTYQPAVVNLLSMLENAPRARMDAAQQAAATRSAPLPLNPDAVYVDAVRESLVDAMLEHSKALDLRPNEWLTVAARGADGAAGPLSEPSVMILRVRGADLIDFLAGRLKRSEVENRVQVRGFSGRR